MSTQKLKSITTLVATCTLSLVSAAAFAAGGAREHNTAGTIIQADWTPYGAADSWRAPWANLRIGVQYTIYDKFNGAAHDYDGFGRNASDNNTLFIFLWTAI